MFIVNYVVRLVVLFVWKKMGGILKKNLNNIMYVMIMFLLILFLLYFMDKIGFSKLNGLIIC